MTDLEIAQKNKLADANNLANNVITPASLTPTTPVKLANSTTDITNYPGITTGVAESIANEYNTLNAQLTEKQKAQETAGTNITDIMNQLTGKTADTQTANELAGVNKATEEQDKYAQQLADLNAQASALNREAQAVPLQVQERALAGSTRGGNAPVNADLLRANALKALSIGQQSDIAAAALTGSTIRLEAAKNKAQQIVDLKYKPLEDALAIKQKNYDLNKDILEAYDKKRTEALGVALKKEETALADKKANETKSNEYILTAIQGKAPANLIAKAQDLINKGAKATEVAKALGNYSLSLADRLDIQLKQAQIDKTNKEINKLKEVNKDAGDLVKINGKDYIRYKDGTISDPVLPEAADTTVVTTRLDNKLKTLDKLTKSSPGLAYSAGALRTPLGKPLGFINQINDWRADATNVIQKLTVDELGRVKSDGVTFGALSNGERQAVGDAATALGAASIRDKEGNPTGEFRMSEKKVIEEFNKIKQGYALDFERRTGMTYDQYLQNPEAVKQKAVDDFIDTAGTALINSNTYGGYPTN